MTTAPELVPGGAAGAVVGSCTEWDPLEEVLVGTLAGAVFPTWQDSMAHVVPESAHDVFRTRGGRPLPEEHLRRAEEELDGFAATLAAEGITVVRPEPATYAAAFETPGWRSSGGLYAAMPRDLLMVVGDAIVEAPMSWRCRYHEIDAFRPLVKSWFRQGARWLPAPKPQLPDELWDDDGVLTEWEPVFDAADFLRFGDCLVGQRSHVTNAFGIEWLRRAVEPEFRVLEIEVDDPHAMHIDATIAPLAPGRLLVNPQRYVPNGCFDGWEVRAAPPPALPADWPMYFCSPWVSMNVLSLGPDTVVVEAGEQPLIDLLTEWGFRCVPVPFRHVYSFGGSFHCVTLDVRRAGSPQRYLNLSPHAV